ncbi:MAG TPA: hypothetical protein VFC10_17805 [Terriglobia bacterium]|nr:hypothetical protein [Terriglobia bacterium]
MRCDTVRQMVEEDVEISPSLRVHLDSCSACKEYLRSWQAVRAGLVALGVESPPEPSIGFTKRVMNRIENAREEIQFGEQFIDQIGRRFVYAMLMVALTLLLVLLLPSSGPLRSSGVSQSVLVQTQMATLSNEQVLGVDGSDSGDAADYSNASGANGNPATRGSQ